MKRNTIKWRIFKYNIIVIILQVILTTIIFNIAVRMYMEKDILGQLQRLASSTETTALQHGPDFFPGPEKTPPPGEHTKIDDSNNNDIFRYYFMLDHSLKEPLTLLNADFILLDKDKNRITPTPKQSYAVSNDLSDQIASVVIKSKNFSSESYLNFNLSGTNYIAIVKPVSDKNSFGLGYIIIYSSLQKVNQLQLGINVILLVILIFSALIIVIFSSLVSKKISAPFSHLNQYIKAIAERNFGNKIDVPVYDELQEFVNNINVMSEKLETYDKAQKTFLQNVSHEFRTPLMSIQSYAEGIKYEVVDSSTASDIIIDESKRLTHLVEDLLYLSRLDAIEENYHYSNLDFNEVVNSCIERMNGIALKNNIKIVTNNLNERILIHADEERLSRAIINIVSNCIRYANSTVDITSKIIADNKVRLIISDDGPGFETNELPNIFERFYKGKKGNFGLGLSISKNIIERLHGRISAENSKSGALFLIELPIIENA
jgi:two-component system, OmpR family, sensor histidine kinase CssS